MSALARLLRITVPFHQAQMRANRLLYGNLTSLQRELSLPTSGSPPHSPSANPWSPDRKARHAQKRQAVLEYLQAQDKQGSFNASAWPSRHYGQSAACV